MVVDFNVSKDHIELFTILGDIVIVTSIGNG